MRSLFSIYQGVCIKGIIQKIYKRLQGVRCSNYKLFFYNKCTPVFTNLAKILTYANIKKK